MTTVKFFFEKYANYQDRYFTSNYNNLITMLEGKIKLTANVNLGVTDGVIIENNFKGDFSNINGAIVYHDTYGTHLYKLIKKTFIKRDLWRITMVKDMVSSKWHDILNSNVLVGRIGMNRNTYDPLLFIEENMQLSEVKTKQILLSELENAKSYGYLGIFKRDSLNGGTGEDGINWKSRALKRPQADFEVDALVDFEGYNIVGETTPPPGEDTRVGWHIGSWISKNPDFATGGVGYDAVSVFKGIAERLSSWYYTWQQWLNQDKDYEDVDITYVTKTDTGGYNLSKVETFNFNYGSFNKVLGDYMQYIGKTIYVESEDKFYEIKWNRTKKGYRYGYNLTNTQVKSLINVPNNATINKTVRAELYLWYFELDYEEIFPEYIEEEYTLNEYGDIVDQPFQMIYTPIIEGGTMRYNNKNYKTDRIVVEMMFYDMIAKYGGQAGKLIDVQMISYSPIDGFSSNWNKNTKTFNVGNEAIDVFINGDVIIPIYEVEYANFQTSITYNINVTDYKVEMKRKYMLTSPSGAGVYNFSVAKNNGLTGFIINGNLRPFSSYFHLAPIYGGVYGNNFIDTRGLIYQEDMSLTQVSDAWETYKRQNINYLNSFNSDVDFKRSQLGINQEANWGNYGFDAGKRMIESAVDAATFAADAVAKDAWFGAKGAVSGGLGAGAIMGGAIASEAIEAGQLAYNNRMDTKLNENEIEYSRQQFNYQIGNIKAIPENVEKVSGIFSTNNIIPYLQVFEPTEEEIVYFTNFLDMYGGNLGMMIDLNEREFNYIQGTILRYGGIITNEEYIELHAQLSKGVRKVE